MDMSGHSVIELASEVTDVINHKFFSLLSF